MSLMHSAQKYYPVLLSDGMGMQDYFDDAMQYLLADENRQANRYTLDEASVATDMAVFVRDRLAKLRDSSAVAALRALALLLVQGEVTAPRQ
ncbi:hypothetical protein [uncultured Desulfovibrio sp.]|uniref:hypothetical protein n=1 Tax=uncultured Desulfovibrio sp. TaxID=167968 RepID=UPI001C39D67E|nr:hypothetical protein [uncultured Desulfovibrio sp.]HIX41097.1 hypothetical protein [Candidatus Desulfovibrio intestinigallinarum]